MKRLIVTADDFGYSRNVNKAIIKCFKEGIVTSTSLLANTKYFDESVKLLKLNKNLDVGIHINLTEFKPLTKAKTLTDKNGNLIHKAKWLNGYYNNADENETEKEIEAQISRAISAGINITHINGHNHIHVFPKIIDAFVKLAKKHKIKYMRLPIEKKKNDFAAFIAKLSIMAEGKILKNNLKVTDAFYGIDNMHDMSFDKFSEILESLKHGVSELMTHPAYADNKGDGFHQSIQREKEIRLLTSKKTMQAIKNLKIRLTNFSKL